MRFQRYFFYLLIAFITVNAYGYDDDAIAKVMKDALKGSNIQVTKVEVIDGRSKGGERGIIVSYIAHPSDQEIQARELVYVLETGYAANKNMGADIDSVAAIIGSKAGGIRGMVTVKTEDTAKVVKTKDMIAYMKKWTAFIYDPTFMTIIVKGMGWLQSK